MDVALIAFVIIVAAAVFLFEWGMLRSVYAPARREHRRIRRRIERIKTHIQEEDPDEFLRDDYLRKNTSFYKRISGLPGVATLTLWIEQAGQGVKVDRFLLVSGASGLAGLVFTWLAFADFVTGVVTGCITLFVPLAKLYAQKKRRLNAFDEQLPEALDIVTRGLRAGHPFNNTLQLVADELHGPVGEEFALTFAELNYGVPTKTALQNLLRRMPSKPLKSLVTAILLQRETGGNLAEILEKISSVVRGGYRFQRKLRTLSAEGRMSATVLSSVPMVLGGGLYGLSPDMVTELFINPQGNTLLYGSAVLYVIGFFWIRRVIRIDV